MAGCCGKPTMARWLRIVRLGLALGCCAALAACSTQPGDIFRTVKLPDDNTVLIGARQRAILNNPVGEGSRPGLVNPDRIVCAEPSPDVALAVAQSLGVGISVFGGSGQGALSGSGATAEGVAQLGERTQAIQLLRDQMYRACEAYANGAITGTTYNLIMSKNNDAMITLMIAGVAGGEFGRAGAAIGGSSSSESSASVSSLLSVLQAADKAADDLKAAEEKETAAKDDQKAKDTIASNQEGKSDTQVADEAAAADDAKEKADAAEDDVQRKKEVKNDADSKARAEITKVIGAGSIAANPNKDVAQVLERMQSNFLDEDFADEYVSACIVEMGLANGGAQEFVRERAKAEDITRAYMWDNFVDHDLDDLKKRGDAYIRFVQKAGTTERYSLLARHCDQKLFDFVVFASTGETALEQEKIRLEAQRIAFEGDETRTQALGLYKQLIDGCGKIADPDIKNRCLQGATTIVERPGGEIQLGAITQIEVPTNRPPLPVVAFDRAAAAKPKFDEQRQALNSATVPPVDSTKMNADDAATLTALFQKLSDQGTTLKKNAEQLNVAATAALAAAERTKLVAHQNERPALLTDVELSEGKTDLEKTIARDKLALHDKESTKIINDYRGLGESLSSATDQITSYLAAIDGLKKAIDAAIKKKAGG